MDYPYPKGEVIWVGHYDKEQNLRYITTSKPDREFYFLYEYVDGKFVKLGKDRDPSKLEKKYVKLDYVQS